MYLDLSAPTFTLLDYYHYCHQDKIINFQSYYHELVNISLVWIPLTGQFRIPLNRIKRSDLQARVNQFYLRLEYTNRKMWHFGRCITP